MAVPTLPTTTPAAIFAKWAESSREMPLARVMVRAAMAVSPAPETSKTSLARVGTRFSIWPSWLRSMPSPPRVMTKFLVLYWDQREWQTSAAG